MVAVLIDEVVAVAAEVLAHLLHYPVEVVTGEVRVTQMNGLPACAANSLSIQNIF